MKPGGREAGKPRRPCWRSEVPPRHSCWVGGGTLPCREAIPTVADAQIYKDELKMNRSQAETQHANPISWPWLRASPLGIPTIYRHMFHRPNRALLCCTDILCMHLRCEPPPFPHPPTHLPHPRCQRQMAAGSEVNAGGIESDLTPVWLT